MGGRHHAHARLAPPLQPLGAELPLRAGEQRPAEVRRQPGQDHLGLGIAEPAVELEHLGSLGGEHQPRVQDPPVVDALTLEGSGRGLQDPFQDPRLGLRVDEGDRAVRTHAAGVRPPVPVPGSLVVLGQNQRLDVSPAHQRQSRDLRPLQALLDQHGPAGVAKHPVDQAVPKGPPGLRPPGGNRDALAGRQAVGLDHDRPLDPLQVLLGRADPVEPPGPRPRDPVSLAQLPGPGLRPLDHGPGPGGAEHREAPGVQRVGQAGHQGPLRPDHREIDGLMFGESGDPLHVRRGHRYQRRQLGDAGVPRGRVHPFDRGIARQRPAQCVLAASPADHQDSHRTPQSSIVSVCSRSAPTETVRMGTAASPATRSRYFLAAAGRSAGSRAPLRSSAHPSSSS